MVTGSEIHKHLGLRSKDDCYGVYVGTQEIRGTYASTKIGRSRNAWAIQRGRAQGGANWWFHSYFQLPNYEATRIVDAEMKRTFESQRIDKAEQGQTELYMLSLDDASSELEALLRSMGFEIRELVDEILENQLYD